MRFLTYVLLSFPLVSFAAPDSVTQTITGLTQTKAVGVQWELGKQLIGDINCDGQKDYVIKGRSKGRIYIAVILGPLSESSRVEVLNFGVGEEKYQNSLLEKDPQVRFVPLNYEPKELLGSELEGYHPSKDCNGVEIGGEESDEINLYWNHKMNGISWWRL
jgi:hypothetical protein